MRNDSSTLDFMIVGTSRSGTTLVQRLALELPGVNVSPETHFLSKVLPTIRRHGWAWPLTVEQARQVLTEVADVPDVDLESLNLSSPASMFASIVRRLAGPFGVVGEKTPAHLRWWRPCLRAWPELKFIGVVRHPCAVLASHQNVPWGTSDPVALATRWNHEQRQLLAARHRYPGQVLILRYEDITSDPSSARSVLAKTLQVPDKVQDFDRTMLAVEGEWWKDRAGEPVDTDRAESWRLALSPTVASRVTGLCSRPMRRLGYRESGGRVPPRVLASSMRRDLKTRIKQCQIERISLV